MHYLSCNFYSGITLDFSSFIPNLPAKHLRETSGLDCSRGNFTLLFQQGNDTLISNVVKYFLDCNSHIPINILYLFIIYLSSGGPLQERKKKVGQGCRRDVSQSKSSPGHLLSFVLLGHKFNYTERVYTF